MPRNFRSEYENYHSKPEAKKDRAKRNKARRMMEREGVVKKGDGLDIDHKKPLSKGGSTARSNLRVQPASANRSFKRTSSGKMK